MIRAAASLSLAAVVIASCATPETRVRNALMDLGLAEPIADCMADRMTERLSLGQLRKLGTLSALQDRKAGDTSVQEFLRQTKALRDPEIVSVTASSAALCTLAEGDAG